jgi:hypothetical protein
LAFEARAKKQVSLFKTVAALSTQDEAVVGELILSQGQGEDAKRFGVSGEARDGKVGE